MDAIIRFLYGKNEINPREAFFNNANEQRESVSRVAQPQIMNQNQPQIVDSNRLRSLARTSNQPETRENSISAERSFTQAYESLNIENLNDGLRLLKNFLIQIQ